MASSFLVVARVIHVIAVLAIAALNAYFLYHVDRLERTGCKCAYGWQRGVMEVTLALFVIAGIIGIFINWQSHFPVLAIIMVFAGLLNVVVTRDFLMRVKSADCKCAETAPFKVLNVWNWVLIGLYALWVLYVVWLLIVMLWVAKSSSGSSARGVARR